MNWSSRGGVNSTLKAVDSLDDRVTALEETKSFSIGSYSFIWKKGSICYLQYGDRVTLPTWTHTVVATLPQEYWPKESVKSIIASNGGVNVILSVDVDGNIMLNPFGNTVNNELMHGSLTYICKD